MADLLSLEDALAAVLGRVTPLPAEEVAVEDLAGRILAEDAAAEVPLPPFPASAMDGYAVRAADLPGRLPVVSRIAAGSPATAPLERGQAMGIATGGVVPEGADAVVPVEDTAEEDGIVEIGNPVERGANVRPPGRDVERGQVIASAGTAMGAAHVGALAAAGVAFARCARRPSVAVLTTGTELRPPGSELGPGEIYEANGVMLTAQIEQVGARVTRLAAVADELGAHRDALAHGLDHDVLVTSGGVSVGPHDLVRRTEAELGVEEVFWGVAVKPGKPVSFGTRGLSLVFGLPGNPVSSLVACELFVKPALLALQGARDPGPRFARGELALPALREPRRDELIRAVIAEGERGPLLTPISGQESHLIVRAAGADALVLVPRGEGELAAGSGVRFLRLR